MQVNLSGSANIELPRLSPTQMRNWMLGQLLNAQVIGRDGENSIRLRVGEVEVRAATALPLQKGDKLTLRVTQLSPVVTLKPTQPPPTPEKEQVRNALSQSLPKQRPLAPLLDRLAATVKATPSPQINQPLGEALPPRVAQAVRSVLQSIPTLAEVRDATRLPRVLERVGVFAESNAHQLIAKSAAELPALDLKWQLLQLRGALRRPANITQLPTQGPADELLEGATGSRTKAPSVPAIATTGHTVSSAPEPKQFVEVARMLSQLVESGIAKIETNQLKAVAATLDGEYQLSLDLPIAVDHTIKVVQLKILRDQQGTDDGTADDASAATTFVLEIPIAGDAVLRAVASQTAERLSIRLWSTDQSLRETIAEQRDLLAARLEQQGLGQVTIALAELKPFDAWGKKLDKIVDVTA